MNIKLKKIRNNTDSRQSEKLVIPHLNSADKYNSSFHRPQLITRTIHSRKNGLTWLLYYTSYVRTTKSLYIKKTSSTTRFVMLNIWGYLRSDQLNGMWSMDQVTILLKLTYIYELFKPMSSCSFLSGHEQPIKNIYGFFIRHSGQLS